MNPGMYITSLLQYCAHWPLYRSHYIRHSIQLVHVPTYGLLGLSWPRNGYISGTVHAIEVEFHLSTVEVISDADVHEAPVRMLQVDIW